jgi:hypothetical protein
MLSIMVQIYTFPEQDQWSVEYGVEFCKAEPVKMMEMLV